MTHEVFPPAGQTRTVLSGTVVSGSGRAVLFTRLDWVKRQCVAKLGFEPYPGTLNISLDGPDLRSLLLSIRENAGIRLVPPDASYCSGEAYPVQIGAIAGAIILPEESVRKHGRHIAEILAPVCLREILNVTDGDRVSITVMTAEATGEPCP